VDEEEAGREGKDTNCALFVKNLFMTPPATAIQGIIEDIARASLQQLA